MLKPSHPLPSALAACARWERLADVPALLVHPDRDRANLVPFVVWMHGRTAHKELDPGRYLRLMRAGIGVCSLDLPGHGERFEASFQHPRHTLELIEQMIDEIDAVTEAASDVEPFDPDRVAIGGMSAGGMAALSRLCRPHAFGCATVEASTGSWTHQLHREMFDGTTAEDIAPIDPITNLDRWREIPLQAIHSRPDTWVRFEGQEAFVLALRERYRDPDHLDFVVYEQTGAPFEHAGFGRHSADAKNRQRDFLRHWLRACP